MSFAKHRVVVFGLLLLVALGATVLVLYSENKPTTVSYNAEHYSVGARRISPQQYRNIIRDVFGETVKITGRFVETEQRHEGLQAIGAGRVSISSMGFEAADEMALGISHQVFSEDRRNVLLPCLPAAEDAFDNECARQFISEAGLLLYRRPLQKAELERQMQMASAVTEQQQDFYAGLERSLANMLVSPHFLFNMEQVEEGPDNRGKYRLTAWSKASRLSFLLWNTTPDKSLLNAAAKGELHTKKGIERQVKRMLDSSRLQDGIRAFFSDMLMLDQFDSLNKDRQIYPQFTHQVAADAREQTLRILVDHLLVQNQDYRNLFTTPKTFLTPSLAALFSMPLAQSKPYLNPDKWVAYEFESGDPRSGILAQPGFVALHAHPGRTSPTLRGKALRENLLCQEVPPPPANVDFNIVEDTSNPNFKTARQRLSAHATMPTCAGCHKITDPIGLALESFDGDGSFRTRENGAQIDTSGEIDSVAFQDAAGLGKALRDNPNITSCLIKRVYSYGTGREVASGDRKWLKTVGKSFAGNGYKFIDLLRHIATSEHFYQENPAQNEEKPTVAKVAPTQSSLAIN